MFVTLRKYNLNKDRFYACGQHLSQKIATGRWKLEHARGACYPIILLLASSIGPMESIFFWQKHILLVVAFSTAEAIMMVLYLMGTSRRSVLD